MRSARIPAMVTAAVVVAVLGILGLLTGRGAPPPAAAEQDWDPRIAGLADEVGRLRGLEFEHPVPVRVLDDAAFEARYHKNAKITKAARKEFARSNALLLAIGLLEEPLDLESVNNAYGTHVLGYYDIHRKEIVVRGDTLQSPSMRVILAHELTHALQDQHFKIRRLNRIAYDAQSTVPRALIEGDATRIEEKYYNNLSPKEREEEDDTSNGPTATDRVEPKPLPAIIDVASTGNYWLGEVATLLLEADGSQRSIDAAFRNPPLDDVALLDPEALLDPFHAAEVPVPELAKGEHRLGKAQRLGAWSLYLVLASRLPPADALAAAERWGGDSFIGFERGSTPCVRVAVAGRRGRADAHELGRSFRAWAAAAPSDTETTVTGDTVTFTTCTPASGAAPVSEGALARALIHLTLRNGYAARSVSSGSSPEQAKCYGTEVMALPEVSAGFGGFTSIRGGAPAGFYDTLGAAVRQNDSAIRARCT